MDEYREQLVNFQKNYWSFLKPSKGGSKFIPSPPLTLIKKTKEMSSRKLSEHVEEELFNKEKRVLPNTEKKKLSVTTENTDSKPVKKKRPYYRKKYNKPSAIEVVVPEPVVTKNYFIHGLITGIILTSIIARLIWVYN